MREELVPDDRPGLLMVSHCVPDAIGYSDRGRAWQLLSLAARTHRVTLVCLVDGPVSLRQWRLIHDKAHAPAIQARSGLARLVGRAWRLVDEPAGASLQVRRACRNAFRSWSGRHSFDTILSTHPGLWPATSALDAGLQICDLHSRQSLMHRSSAQAQSGRPLPSVRRAWHRRQSRRYDRVERQAAGSYDLVLLGSSDQLCHYANEPCDKLVLPEALDLAFFDFGGQIDADGNPGDTSPVIVLHTDQRHRRWARRWFMNRVWPEVKQAVPDAAVMFSGPEPGRATIRQLQSASVIASPLRSSPQTLWPILQAMAAARTVIAGPQTLEHLEARHGEHLLTPRRDKEWVTHCVESLRNASVRLQLARGARTFVETHCRIDTTMGLIANVSRGPQRTVRQIARAA